MGDLICKLLVKSAKDRLSARDVLQHQQDDWCHLETPGRIRKNNSARALSQFAESAAAVNRVVQQHCRTQTETCNQSMSFAGLSPPADSYLLQRRRSLALQSTEVGLIM